MVQVVGRSMAGLKVGAFFKRGVYASELGRKNSGGGGSAGSMMCVGTLSILTLLRSLGPVFNDASGDLIFDFKLVVFFSLAPCDFSVSDAEAEAEPVVDSGGPDEALLNSVATNETLGCGTSLCSGPNCNSFLCCS